MIEDIRRSTIDEPGAMNARMKTVENAAYEPANQREDGRLIARKTVGDDKTYNITATNVAANSVTQAMMTSGSVGQSQWKYEVATLAFASGDTSKTASVTSGSIVIGCYSSSVTSTPAQGELQLSISSTTLTGARSAAPGGAAAQTYTIILLKT